MKGAIYFKNIGKTQIKGCEFMKNDPGPVLDNFQAVGLHHFKPGVPER